MTPRDQLHNVSNGCATLVFIGPDELVLRSRSMYCWELTSDSLKDRVRCAALTSWSECEYPSLIIWSIGSIVRHLQASPQLLGLVSEAIACWWHDCVEEKRTEWVNLLPPVMRKVNTFSSNSKMVISWFEMDISHFYSFNIDHRARTQLLANFKPPDSRIHANDCLQPPAVVEPCLPPS